MRCTSHLRCAVALAPALMIIAPVLVAAKGHYEPDSASSLHLAQNLARVRPKEQRDHMRDLMLTW